jgi:hypothetical protein
MMFWPRILLDRQPRNRRLTDVVAPGDCALRLTSFEALAGLFLLVRREDRNYGDSLLGITVTVYLSSDISGSCRLVSP